MRGGESGQVGLGREMWERFGGGNGEGESGLTKRFLKGVRRWALSQHRKQTVLLSSVFPGNRLAICGRSQSSGISGTVRCLCRLSAKFPPSTILTEWSQVDEVEKELGPSWGPNHLPKSYKLDINGLPPSHLGIPPFQIWGKTWGLKIFKKSSFLLTYSGFERQRASVVLSFPMKGAGAKEGVLSA